MELMLTTGILNPKKGYQKIAEGLDRVEAKVGRLCDHHDRSLLERIEAMMEAFTRFSDSIERHQEGLRIFRQECEQWEKREKRRHLFSLLACLVSLVASCSVLYCRYYYEHTDSC
ncbi:hypothetical protein CI102_13965 [Trichoderma harzianum]|nr:hypothetical protein CI102_13965 [Trichoderma harzianum]